MSVLIWGLLHTGVESHLAGVALIMLMVVATAGPVRDGDGAIAEHHDREV